MRLEIYSDVVCPWCYIGKRRLEAALDGHPARDELSIVWRPFQLDPQAPPIASPIAAVYARKFGGPDQARAIIERVTGVAASVGLEFRLDRAVRANTFDAHRLLWWVGEGPEADLFRQGELAERFFRAYFVEGADLGDRPTLAALARDVGVDDAAGVLASTGASSEVRTLVDGALDREVTAVPTFVFDDRLAVPGAQEPELFRRVLDRLVLRPGGG